MSGADAFYNGLAEDYDCLFDDWWSAARWHGAVIAAMLANEGVVPPAAVLDCACGIGTQALSLASLGYVVTGTDISAAAVQRARREAAAREIGAEIAVADMRRVHEAAQGPFDAVIVCDNALPHLLTDDDLATALRSARACLRPGGAFVASIRDYDELLLTRPGGVPIAVHGPMGARHASGQAWTWSPVEDLVHITLFTMRESDDGWRAAAHETTYRALRQQVLTDALCASGYSDPRWLTPRQSGYYQPIVMARADGG